MATVQTYVVANPTPNAIPVPNGTPNAVPAGETVEVALSVADTSGEIAGLVAAGAIVAPGPNSSLTNGGNLTLSAATGTTATTTVAVAATNEQIPVGSQVTLNDNAGHEQTVTTTAIANIGATSLTVASFTPAVAYPTTSTVTVAPQDALHNATELIEKGAFQLYKMVQPIFSANGDTWGVKGLYQGATSGFVGGGN